MGTSLVVLMHDKCLPYINTADIGAKRERGGRRVRYKSIKRGRSNGKCRHGVEFAWGCWLLYSFKHVVSSRSAQEKQGCIIRCDVSIRFADECYHHSSALYGRVASVRGNTSYLIFWMIFLHCRIARSKCLTSDGCRTSENRLLTFWTLTQSCRGQVFL